MASTVYILVKWDDARPTHVLREANLPKGEIWQLGGYLFVPPELASRMGEPDSTAIVGGRPFPAWKMNARGEVTSCIQPN